MLRYAIYARKSDDDTSKTEKSIGEQLEESDKVALRDGLTVVWRHDESKSAKIPGVRPVWRDLVSHIERGKVDAILCWHINRLARNMKEAGELVQLMIDGKLREIRTPHAVYRTGDNIIPLALESASAAQYSLDLTNTVKRALQGNFKSGGCNHRARQGYVNARDPLNLKRGIVLKDGRRFLLMRKTWELLATGAYTPPQVARVLNETWGFRTRPTRKTGGKPLSASSLYTIFRDPFYAGFVRYKGEVVKGRHEPMISVETFAAVQAVMDRHTVRATRQHEHTYTGLMRCAYCGQQITAEQKRLKNGALWKTYRCSDSKHACTQKGLSEGKLEAKFLALLESVRIEPGWAKLACEEITKRLETGQEALTAKATAQARALEACEERLRNLAEMWLSGLLRDEARYRTIEDQELKRKNSLVLAVEECRTELERMRLNAERATRFLSVSPDLFIVGPPVRKRAIAQALGFSYTFSGREKKLEAEVTPLIREMKVFASTLKASLEPLKTGSQKQKEPAFDKSILVGGTGCERIELPEPLLSMLKGPLFPEVFEEQVWGSVTNDPAPSLCDAVDEQAKKRE